MPAPLGEHPTIRVLVVDERGGRAGLEKRLRARGYAVDTATDGAGALERVDDRSPDVVVTDLKMLRMDGLELMARLRARYADLPVIMVTSFGDVRSAVTAMRLGAEHYLVRPVDFGEFHLAIDRAVERRDLRAEVYLLRREVQERDARARWEPRLRLSGSTAS